MYSRGGNSYPQQSYAAQSSYSQNPTAVYSGSSAVSAESGSQLGIGSRHQTTLGASHEPDIGAYRGHPASSGHYGAPYSSLLGASSLSISEQVSAISNKGGGYGSMRLESPNYASADYISSSSHIYSHKSDRLVSEKVFDYSSLDRRQYGDRQSAYLGRDMSSDTAARYADSVSYVHRQPEIYDRIDQAVLREQMLKTQSLQSASHDSAGRQADYLAARSGALCHLTRELDPYIGRLSSDPRDLSTASRSPYGGQHTSSILGAAPQRSVDDLLYSQGSANPGYGISLPPGRDYGIGKGLHGSTLTKEIPGSISSCSGYPRADDWKDERAGFSRDYDVRDVGSRRERLRERERVREREKEKERERERIREREREHERERERERGRKRMLEMQERERDREHKRALEVRRERTPLRLSREHHVPSLMRDGMRRNSPRIGTSHRLHSPVKEKRREYVCKVCAFGLNEERDFLSVFKRYPKLYISPDFSKLVVNWPKVDMKFSFHTPVSFEHDYIEEESLADKKVPSVKQCVDTVNSGPRSTVWNAKMILMSGLSRSAVEELSSERLSDDRVPHICSFLRFAVLKKDRSFMAIGGQWDPMDGGDPSVDNSLVRTVLRHAKDITHLDLQNCQHWNRFLEIHYDRVGENGLFSHKEITVLFAPNLSDCLPSLDAWREQWLAHKKAVAERERNRRREKERSRERKDGLKDRAVSLSKGERRAEKSEMENTGIGHKTGSTKTDKIDVSVKEKETEVGREENVYKLEKNDDTELAGEIKNVEKKEETDNAISQDSAKPGKKKVVRRIVKQKVVAKKAGVDHENKNSNMVDEKEGEDKDVKSEASGLQDMPSADSSGIKIPTRKKTTKKPVERGQEDPIKNEGEENVSDLEDENKPTGSLDKAQVGKSDSSASGVVRDRPMKKMIKRKIIKRVPKKKIAGSENTESKNTVYRNGETENEGNVCLDEDKKAAEGSKLEEKVMSNVQSGTDGTEKEMSNVSLSNAETKIEVRNEADLADERRVSETEVVDADKQKIILKDDNDNMRKKFKDREILGDEEKSRKDRKDGQRNVSRDVENKKSADAPRHPGFILQPKSGKASRLISLSLSLDSLLDYTDEDVEESTFELSLFAETMYEMLQYQMGSRILGFLQKVRSKFIQKRSQKKRQREEAVEKKKDDSSSKRLKGKISSGEMKSSESELNKEAQSMGEKSVATMEMMETVKADMQIFAAENVERTKQEGQEINEEEIDEVEVDEDEDPEEDEENQDGSPFDPSKENDVEGKNDADADAEPEKLDVEVKSIGEEPTKEKDMQVNSEGSKEMTYGKDDAKENAAATAEVGVDKELLQAFRFFDRNRVGYIRVEDMRVILHNLGKFLCHRDVKELAQSALLESNTGRDERILYEKLVRRMSGL